MVSINLVKSLQARRAIQKGESASQTRDPVPQANENELDPSKRTRKPTWKVSESGVSSVPDSAAYKNAAYEKLLKESGCFLKSAERPNSKSAKMCRRLLEHDVAPPAASLFQDELLQYTVRRLEKRNEARVVMDLTRLLVPSAESLAIHHEERQYSYFYETINEGWIRCMKITSPRPQPDYAVGFKKQAFSAVQLRKAQPFIGTDDHLSYFKATREMLFPFLACEVKADETDFPAARRQNTHSMAVAVRGVVALFKLLGEEHTLDQKVLAFSVVHDRSSVMIHGHYPITTAGTGQVNCYTVSLYQGRFTDTIGAGSRGRWTSFQFVMNVYRIWAPAHFEMLCSAMERLPNVPNAYLDQK
ncbi:hypothetical protein K470DRAFT_262574 [Piedraia hortae CBS 480.64]|uniref:DUF7924 domain-containing protein n=1 Tax=Piedraia hortae CBS 480.64 TaxID=1314780 RepID=A0A6A7C5N8_9PEZI|nr:hypothetical protein K470DRAFT_262574 [Piedraia hortae CBS 480.64]